jgi:TorA maturation chaperone TorD
MEDLKQNDEINGVRSFFYELIKMSFYKEPDENYLNIIGEFIRNIDSDTYRENEYFSEKLGQMVDIFSFTISNLSTDEIKDEYNELFINPFSNNLINTNASYYIDKKNFGDTLINIREFLKRNDLEKSANLKEPEDSITFLTDLMLYLINSKDTTENQIELFENFINPLFLNIQTALKTNEKANFYKCIGYLIDFFLTLEKGYIAEISKN